MRRVIRKMSTFAIVLGLVTTAMLVFGYYIIPDNVTVSSGKPSFLGIFVPAQSDVQAAAVVSDVTYTDKEVQYDALGLIPVKTVTVHETQRKELCVGGDVIGLQMLTDGVIVVDVQNFETENGSVSPAEQAGLQAGDIIIKVNGTEVSDNGSFAAAIENSAGQQTELTVTRGSEEKVISILPQKCKNSGKYRCGALVRDATLGIGTMTFYDPQTGIYGALGHSVSDADTGEMLPIAGGQIVDAYVWNIKKGERGTAGELGGALQDDVMGSIEKNCVTGVYGLLYDEPLTAGLYPVAWATEVRTGPCEIMLSLDGETIESYDAQISRINIDYEAEIKNMVVEITDEELLAKTGGIVQGMSGSPIIQDGKLVGAVTHVLVNDPTRGYGIFIENMLEAAG